MPAGRAAPAGPVRPASLLRPGPGLELVTKLVSKLVTFPPRARSNQTNRGQPAAIKGPRRRDPIRFIPRLGLVPVMP